MSPHSHVLCAGIVVADYVCTPITHLPAAGELVLTERILLTIGGCAANVAVDLAKMEVPSTVLGRVGGDVPGRVVSDLLRGHRIDVSALQVSPQLHTSQTLIVNVAGQDRRFIHTVGANAEFSAADIPADRVRGCRVLYVGGYFVLPGMRQEELAPVFAAARSAGARTMLDVVTPGKGEYLSRLEKLLPHVDVFLPNNHEAELITGESDPLQQAECFRGLGAGTVIITLGGDGAILVSERTRLKAGAYSVDFVDGSGGGDAFDAGYIYGLLHNLAAEDCLRVASALGASCVREVGTTTGVFTKAECEKFLREHTLPIERV
jgi:sugar/nucleoside kinase (ribokinase family)